MEINWVVLTYFIVGMFAISGFYRGWWKEGITTGALAILLLLLSQPPLAGSFISTLNSIIRTVWSFAPEFFIWFFEELLAIELQGGEMFQFDAGSAATWILFLTVFVFVSIIVSRRSAPADAILPMGSFFGALVGGFNGFLLLNLVREYLDGRYLPAAATASGTEVGSSVASTGVMIQATQLPTFTIMDSLVPWIVITISLLIFLAALQSRVGLPKNKVKFWQLNYKKPYGYN